MNEFFISQKISQSYCTFQKELDLDIDYEDGCEYELCQVGYNHRYNYGVYIKSETDGKWYNFIDKKVKLCEENDALNCQDSNYLIYKRKGILL